MRVLKWTITSKTIVFVVTIYIYQNIWTAEVDESFICEREPLNSSDRYAVAVLKDDITVGSCHGFCPCFYWKMVQLIVWLLAEEDIPQIYHRVKNPLQINF